MSRIFSEKHWILLRGGLVGFGFRLANLREFGAGIEGALLYRRTDLCYLRISLDEDV